MTGVTSTEKEIFIAYASRDRSMTMKMADLLRRDHVKILMCEIEQENGDNKQLSHADIVLFMVSPDFLDSDYCYRPEIIQAIEQHKQGNKQVIPILLRPIYWGKTPFADLTALPEDTQSIIMHDKPGQTLKVVINTIQSIISTKMATLPQAMELPSLNQRSSGIQRTQLGVSQRRDLDKKQSRSTKRPFSSSGVVFDQRWAVVAAILSILLITTSVLGVVFIYAIGKRALTVGSATSIGVQSTATNATTIGTQPTISSTTATVSAPATVISGGITSYSAPQPGPGCDLNGGIWTPSPIGAISNITCGTTITIANNQTRGYLSLQLPGNQAYSSTNRITVTSAVGSTSLETSQECVGLAEQDAHTGYLVEYCNNGQWFIYSVSGTGAVIKTLASNITFTRQNETISLTLKSASLTFTIDTEIHTINLNGPFHPTKVAVTAYCAHAGNSVTVNDFSYIIHL